MKRLSIFLVLLLSACATAQNNCDSAAREELASVDQMIAETRANLDRGYAIHNSGPSVGINFCAGNSSGNIGISFCTSPGGRSGEKPVAIDAQEERRKLQSLEARREELSATVAREEAACTQA